MWADRLSGRGRLAVSRRTGELPTRRHSAAATSKPLFNLFSSTRSFLAMGFRDLLKMFSDIPQLRPFPRLTASCRIPSLHGQHLNCPHSDRVVSYHPVSLACRT